MNSSMFMAFMRIAERLNHELKIKPLLYGSLGLEQVANLALNPSDIDILIPQPFIESRFGEIEKIMNDLGYRLIDLSEHEFVAETMHVAFAKIEELGAFADIDVGSIRDYKADGIEYKLLNLEQYYSVYKRSSADGYRKTKKNKQDNEKIRMIELILSK
ncbi:hypothetical protein [Cohnella sp. 56]|uniref:hypothetical protein n=1 Tax=Cohnella sp. 56 TaxID=3113722 RepID=UPI0030EB0E52